MTVDDADAVDELPRSQGLSIIPETSFQCHESSALESSSGMISSKGCVWGTLSMGLSRSSRRLL